MGFRNVIFSRAFSALLILILAIAGSSLISSCGSSRSAASSRSAKAKAVSASSGASKSKNSGTIKIDSSLAPETRALLAEASKWLGTSYRYGGDSRSGVDCSGLVINLYSSALSIKLPRSSAQQQEYCSRISKKDLIEGDLVFFTTGGGSKVNHVGMYVGDGRMVHSSTSRGVIVSSLDEAYYTRTFHSAGRVDSYYAMVKGKKPGKSKNTEPISPAAPPSPNDDVILAQTTPPAKTSQTVSDRIIEEVVKPAVKQTAVIATGEMANRLAKSTGLNLASADVSAARKAIELTRRRILDETLNQKVDSIVSEYFD